MTFNSGAGGAGGGGGIVGTSSKFTICLLFLALAVISGWALKHYTIGGYTMAAYQLLLAHSVICLLRFTHPNAGTLQRIICDQSRQYAPIVFITLVIADLMAQPSVPPLELSFANWRIMSISLYAGHLMLHLVRQYALKKSWILMLIVDVWSDICVLWNVCWLGRIAFSEELYWALGLAMLVNLNHFVLWRLALHFNISQLEISTLGMCFSVFFTINLVQEFSEFNFNSPDDSTQILYI